MSTELELQNWLNGTATGGPEGDGRYPLTYADGQVYLVYCPVAQALNPAVSEQPIEVFSGQAATAASEANAAAVAAANDRIITQSQAANAAQSAIAALASKNAAGVLATKADQWANAAQDTEVEPGKYSAKHWAELAAAAAGQVVSGGLMYRTTWAADGGTYPPDPVKGDFYKISTGGTISGTVYDPGDAIIYNGTDWDKIDNTEAVSSVAGRTGAIVLSAADISGLGALATLNSVAWATQITGKPTTFAGYGITMNAARLAGRSTAGLGAVEEIQIGDGMTLAAGVLSAPAVAGAMNAAVQNGSSGTLNATEATIGTVTITPAAVGSQIMIIARVNLLKDIGTTVRTGTIRVRRGATNGDPQVGLDSVIRSQATASTEFGPAVVVALDSPNTLSQVTYTVRGLASAAAGATIPSWELTVVELRGRKGDQGPQGIQGPAGPGGTWGSIGGSLPAQTDLQNALDAKSATGHGHTIGNVTGLQSALDSKSATGHGHTIGDVTGLQNALDGKAATVHTHAIGDVTGLQNALDGKAASTHGHAISGVTGLQTALDTKIAAGTSAVLNELRIDRGDLAGTLFLGPSNDRYLHYDGVAYAMPGANLWVNGAPVWTSATFTPSTKLDTTGGAISGTLGVGGGAAAFGAQHTVHSPGGTQTYLNLWQSGIGTGGIGFNAGSSTLRVVNSYATGNLADGLGLAIDINGYVTAPRLYIGTDPAYLYTPAPGGIACFGNWRVFGDQFVLWANSGGWQRIPRTFVQSGDPGAAAADGDLWIW